MGLLQVRAGVFNPARPRTLTVRRFEIPEEQGPGWLLLNTELAGICGSDLHRFAGSMPPGEYIGGHEIVGRVARAGAGARDAAGQPLQVGDRVVPESTLPCGHCVYCRGVHTRADKWVDYAACERYELFGNYPAQEPVWLSGGFGEMVQVPPHGLVHRVAEEVPAEEVVLAEPLAVAVRAVRVAGVTLGDTVVVQGPGPIGLLTTVAAQLAGATTVVLVGRAGDERRLDIGMALGAACAVQSSGDDLRQLVGRLTGGQMAERVLDATGAAAAFWQGVQLTARGGVFLSMGSFQPDAAVSIYPDHLMRSKIDIRFSHTGANCFQDAIRIIESRRFPLGRLVTRTVSLAETEAAFADLLERRTDDAKIVIDPAG